MNMHVYCSLLVAASWTAALVCQNCRTEIYYEKVCPIPYGDILIERATHSVTACAVMCASNVSCRSFLYETHSTLCKTNTRYTVSRSVPSTIRPPMHSVPFPTENCTAMAYYGIVHRMSCLDLWLDGPCATNSDCAPKNNTACIENRCVCDVGYSRFLRVDACVPDCAGYGLVSKPGRYEIIDYTYLTNVNIRSPFVLDLDCWVGCMWATPECRYYQYKPGTEECYISAETALTKPDAVSYTGSHWKTFHRDCY